MKKNQVLATSRIIVPVILLLLGLTGVACQSQALSGTGSSVSTATPGTIAEDVISDMPRCRGMEKLEFLKFDWPDVENALERLADYNWGYYTCAMAQPELSEFYRVNMMKPPFLWRQVNHAEHDNGIVVLFYHPVKVTWGFLWMLPGPDAQSSYLIISRSDPGEPQAWECRLSSPEILAAVGNGGQW